MAVARAQSFVHLEEDEAEEQSLKAGASKSLLERIRTRIVLALLRTLIFLADLLIRPVGVAFRFDDRVRNGWTLNNAMDDLKAMLEVAKTIPTLFNGSLQLTPRQVWEHARMFELGKSGGDDGWVEADIQYALSACLGVIFAGEAGASVVLMPFTGVHVCVQNVTIAYAFCFFCWHLSTKAPLLAGINLLLIVGYGMVSFGNTFSTVALVVPPLFYLFKSCALVLALAATWMYVSPDNNSTWLPHDEASEEDGEPSALVRTQADLEAARGDRRSAAAARENYECSALTVSGLTG